MSDLLNSASLVMIPSGYAEDKVYSAVPTDGSGDLSFTRASNGTRINSAGLVEVVPWNLLQYSEDFANTSIWTQDAAGTGTISVTANYGVAPNGTTTADRVQMTKGSIYTQIYQQMTVISQAQYTLSVYLKSLSGTPTITTLYNTAVAGTKTLTTEWVRYDFTFIASSSTIYPMIALYGSDSASMDVLAWGYQLNIGATAKPYFPTTDRLNVPRLTYQNGGGGCPSLLLEKQSTNLATYSEDATQWNQGTNVGSITVTANQTISPDGTQNADKVQFPAVGSGSQYATLFFPFTASATAYTGSMWLRGENGGEVVWLNFTKDGVTYTQTLCTLTTSWQRFTLSSTLTSGADNFQIGVDTRDSAESAKPAQTIFVWGRQLEQSSYPTSYIPTTSASATRVKDLAYKSSATALIGQTEGVLFCDFNLPSIETSGDYPFIVNMWKNPSNRFGFARYPNGGVHIYMQYGGSAQFTYNTTQLTGRFKLALGYKANDCVIYLNGTLLQTITSATIPATNDIIFNGINTSGDYNTQLQINQAVLFKTKLTNAELIALTTI